MDIGHAQSELQRERLLRWETLAAIAARGTPLPEELERLGASLTSEVTLLRAFRVDEAEQVLAEETEALERELSRLEAAGATNAVDLLAEVIRLGQQIRWRQWLSDSIRGEARQDPLTFVESEIDWMARRARDMASWDKALRPCAEEVGRRVRKLRDDVWQLKVSRLLAAERGDEDTQVLPRLLSSWRANEEAFALELDAPSGGQDDGKESRRGANFAEREALDEKRRGFRKRCDDLFSEAGVPERYEFTVRVAADIADDASAILSEAGAAEPARQIRALYLLRRRIAAFFEVLGAWQNPRAHKDVKDPERRNRLRAALQDLRGLQRSARTLQREREAYQRLEEYFGPKKVRRFERFIFVLIFVFLGLIVTEWRLPKASPWIPRLHLLDVILCFFFQVDFFVRWHFARWQGSYFLRHFFLESLPAIPFGYLIHTYGVGWLGDLRLAFGVRLLRLRAVLLVVLRFLRVAVFFVRGTDRAVERFRPVLDRDVVLFDADLATDVPESPLRRRLLDLESAQLRMLRSAYDEVPWSQRDSVLVRYAQALASEATVSASQSLSYAPKVASRGDRIRLDFIIRRCTECDVARTLSFLGRDGARRVSRWLRFLDIPLFRSAPIVRRLIPAARQQNPPEAVASAAQVVGQLLGNFVDMLRFWGDLSGITTGPQILNRVATAVITASKRPAMRLLVFAVLVLLVEAIAAFFQVRLVENVAGFLGVPILILGSVCVVLLLLGRWLKRVSGEALDVYLRTADAHFYTLLKTWKSRRRQRDLGRLYEGVVEPEVVLRRLVSGADRTPWYPRLEESLGDDAMLGGAGRDDAAGELNAELKLVGMLYRDYLDGPILHRDDDKTTAQLLGNLTIQDLRRRTLGLSRKQLRKLESLDLEKTRVFSLGPYLWFRFITESLAIETAKLVKEYNSCALPLERLEAVAPQARERFDRFLKQRLQRWEATARLPRDEDEIQGEPLAHTEFHALHFLTAEPSADARVKERFGDEVLAALRQDRRGVVRDVFGTRPYHLQPLRDRMFNPYRLYRRYFGGARFVLLPFVALFGGLRLASACFRELWRLIQEVLGRTRVLRSLLSREAGFDVAVRKINRMRKPAFMEALRLRAAVDAEYLGLQLPGLPASPAATGYTDDLGFIGATVEETRELAAVRQRATADLRRLRNSLAARGWLEDGLAELFRVLDATGRLFVRRGEVMRALVTAFITDHASLRTVLTASAEARQFVERALERKETRLVWLELSFVGVGLFWLPRNRRRRRLFREYVAGDESLHGLSPKAYRKAWRGFLDAESSVEEALRVAVEERTRSSAGEDMILEKLREVAWNYPSWTRKIVTVRTLQILTVVDIQAYRDVVWEAGAYGDDVGRGERVGG